MSRVVKRSLTVTWNNCQSYILSYPNLTLHGTSWGLKCTMMTSSTSYVYARLNDTANAILYPNATAHPISMDYKYNVTAPIAAGTATAILQIDEMSIANISIGALKEKVAEQNGYVAQWVTDSTRSSVIRICLKTTYLSAISCGETCDWYVALSFYEYDFAASKGAGIATASVSAAHGYDGDTVTYTATVENGYVFDGWYNGTMKVSSDSSYTHTVAGADLTLTAKAVENPSRKRYLLCGNDVRLGDEISDSFSVRYGSRTLVENLNGSKTLLCKGKYMTDKVYLGTRSADCANSIMPYHLVAMACYGDWLNDTVLKGSAAGTVDASGWCVTPFLPVPEGCTSITIEAGGTQSNSSLHEFGENFGYLSYWGGGANPRTFNFDYPAAIRYVRASFNMSHIKDCFIRDNTHNTYIFRGGDVI